jgi:hypothetical protein
VVCGDLLPFMALKAPSDLVCGAEIAARRSSQVPAREASRAPTAAVRQCAVAAFSTFNTDSIRPKATRLRTGESWLMSSDQKALEHWMLEHLRRQPPRPLLHFPSDIRPERFWPAQSRSVASPDASVILCHPLLGDLFPSVEEIKIGRSPRSPARGRQCRFPSSKSGDRRRAIRASSTLEFENLRDHEINPDCLQMVEQPIVVRFALHGKPTKHRPDLFVIWKDGTCEFQEVKYEKNAAATEDKWKAIAAALNGLGFGYRIRTEEYIRRQPRYANICTIYENRMSDIPDNSRLIRLQNKLCSGGPLSIDTISKELSIAQNQICALVRRGFLAVQLETPLSADSLISLGWASLQDIG